MSYQNNLEKRRRHSLIFQYLCFTAAIVTIALLFFLVSRIIYQGYTSLDWQFLTSFPSRFIRKAGIISALSGSLWLLAIVALVSIPLGIATAVFIEEYLPENYFRGFIKLNIANLAGVPSIVYGILGLMIFVRFLSLDRSLLAGGFTLSLLIMPIIIITTSEALLTVPKEIRLAAYALGGTKRLVIWYHILPAALPNIMTGIILALSRAIGETAPLLIVGGLAYVSFVPTGIMDEYSALPIQIYNWAGRPQAGFHQLAASGIIVLLVVLLTVNGIAVYIRHRFSKELS